MTILKKILDINTKNQIEFVDITEQIQAFVDESHVRDGHVLIFADHTTTGLAINHNEPLLLQDFMRLMYKLVPVDDQYTHDLFELKKGSKSDGRSNGHSHCKALILGSSETIPVESGKLLLGPNQSVFAVEFDGARRRSVILQIMGE